MIARTPVKKRRTWKPRRGRVVDHEFVTWMHATFGCLVAFSGGCSGRLTLHHVRRFGEQKNDRRSLMLCEAHHQHGHGKDAIEHGKAQFERKFGVAIEAAIEVYNAKYERDRSMTSAFEGRIENGYIRVADIGAWRRQLDELEGREIQIQLSAKESKEAECLTRR